MTIIERFKTHNNNTLNQCRKSKIRFPHEFNDQNEESELKSLPNQVNMNWIKKHLMISYNHYNSLGATQYCVTHN